MRTYSRKPILLGKNSVAWIQVFEKTDDIDDIMFGVWDDFDGHEKWKESAREFISQLKDNWSVTFLKELRSEIDDIIKTETDEEPIDRDKVYSEGYNDGFNMAKRIFL